VGNQKRRDREKESEKAVSRTGQYSLGEKKKGAGVELAKKKKREEGARRKGGTMCKRKYVGGLGSLCREEEGVVGWPVWGVALSSFL